MAVSKLDKTADKILALGIISILVAITLMPIMKMFGVEEWTNWFYPLQLSLSLWVLTLYEGYTKIRKKQDEILEKLNCIEDYTDSSLTHLEDFDLNGVLRKDPVDYGIGD